MHTLKNNFMIKFTKTKKQISLILVSVQFLLLYSCSKITPENHAIVQTVTRNIILDSNTITLSAATNIAQAFLQTKNKNFTITIKDAQTIVKNGRPYFHIINANKGFVIVSPDSLYSPILAYDSIGNFSFADKDLNPGLVNWMNKQAHELDFIRNTKNAYTDSIGTVNKLLWRIISKSFKNTKSENTNGSNAVKDKNKPILFSFPTTPISSVQVDYSTESKVGPLCTTFWDQNYPFNQYCPMGTGGNTTGNNFTGGPTYDPAGCVPIAMAQVMYFWQYPNTYNWTSMVRNPSILSTSYSVNPGGYTESARLINDIGNTWIMSLSGFPSQFADYGTSKTGADDAYCPAILSGFGYSSADRTISIANQFFSGAVNGTSYAGLLTNDIQNNNRPCIVSGYTDETGWPFQWPIGDGHTWVCDGSDKLTFYSGTIDTYYYRGQTTIQNNVGIVGSWSMLHMNWGWGQTLQGGLGNNGWYNCNIDYTTSPTNPTYSNPTGIGANYQYFQTIIYNIQP